jgi:hypothetical protein
MPKPSLGSDAANDVFDGLGLDTTGLDFGSGDDSGSGNAQLEFDDADDDSDPPTERDEDVDGESGDDDESLDDLRLSQTPPQGGERGIRQPPAKSGNKFDKRGNILNAQGQIVASSGREARLYTNFQKLQAKTEGYQRELDAAGGRLNQAIQLAERINGELSAFKAQQKQMTDLGMKPEDQLAAMQLYSKLRRDPSGTIQGLLTRAAAQGININGGGNPQQPNQLNGFADILNEQFSKGFKPLTDWVQSQQQRDQQQNEQAQKVEAARREFESFFNLNPDANTPRYRKVIESLLQSNDPSIKSMSLSEMWSRIQLQEMRLNGNGRPAQNGRGNRRLPNGRQMPPSRNRTQTAPPNQDYGAILNEILDEAGV